MDRKSLEILTVPAIQKWALAFVAFAGDSAKENVRARRSINAKLQRFKALFSERRVLRFIRDEVALPDPVPFDLVDPFEDHPEPYRSQIDLPDLIQSAVTELGTRERAKEESVEEFQSRHEQFKIFVLAVCVGLRRAEIDKLKWEQVDFEKSAISIYVTDVMRLKRPSASGTMDVEPQVMAILKKYHE